MNMMENVSRMYPPLTLKEVKITGGFWKQKQNLNNEITIPAVYARSKETGRIDAFKLDWKSGMPNQPHIFWDSDVAKWLESAAYNLYLYNDNSELKEKVDECINLICSAQQDDGYLNVAFTLYDQDKRWKNLRDRHELYCAGHLIEAAVALHDYLGDDRLLDTMCKYADYIDSVFGREDGKMRGYPGHQEIELALVKLYYATNNKKYLELSKYFVTERGQYPYYFDIEAKLRGEPLKALDYLMNGEPSKPHDFLYSQAQCPAEELEEATGHAVRANYYYSGIVDIAMEYHNGALLDAMHRIWDDIAYRKMYITGGCGDTFRNEGWSFPYILPNDTAYAETCAAIAWVLFNHRLSQTEINGKYADMMERALYNGVMSALSLTGDSFFYVNPLEISMDTAVKGIKNTFPERQNFFGCSCCPPNITRLLSSIGNYVYNFDDFTNSIIVNLYTDSHVKFNNDEYPWDNLNIKMDTHYPWDGRIEIIVSCNSPALFKFYLRIPEWCQKNENNTLSINNIQYDLNTYELKSENGYICIDREWKDGDILLLNLDMSIQRVYSNPKVKTNRGKVAIQRGPVVYCVENTENWENFETLVISRDKGMNLTQNEALGDAITTIRAEGTIRKNSGRNTQDRLYIYGSHDDQELIVPVRFELIPYYTWGNRGQHSMKVWIDEK